MASISVSVNHCSIPFESKVQTFSFPFTSLVFFSFLPPHVLELKISC